MIKEYNITGSDIIHQLLPKFKVILMAISTSIRRRKALQHIKNISTSNRRRNFNVQRRFDRRQIISTRFIGRRKRADKSKSKFRRFNVELTSKNRVCPLIMLMGYIDPYSVLSATSVQRWLGKTRTKTNEPEWKWSTLCEILIMNWGVPGSECPKRTFIQMYGLCIAYHIAYT